MRHAVISATGSYLPTNEVRNEDLNWFPADALRNISEKPALMRAEKPRKTNARPTSRFLRHKNAWRRPATRPMSSKPLLFRPPRQTASNLLPPPVFSACLEREMPSPSILIRCAREVSTASAWQTR